MNNKGNRNKPAFLAFLAALYFCIASIIIHVLKTDLDFFRYPLSRYALGNDGVILELGFYCIGITEIILSLNLLKLKANKIGVSALLLFISGIGAIMVGMFHMDIPPIKTFKGIMHILGATIELSCFPFAVFMFGLSIKDKLLSKISVFTGIATFILSLIVGLIFIDLLAMIIPVYGLIQKVNLLIITLWLIVISYKMIYFDAFTASILKPESIKRIS